MTRGLVLAGAGIAVLLGGGAVTVFWATGDAPATGEAVPAIAPPAELVPPRLSGPAPVVTPRALPPVQLPKAARSGPARKISTSRAADGAATPLASRVLSKAVRKALRAPDVQSRLATCVDRDIGYGGGARPGRIPRAPPPLLLLELETGVGEARIVEVRVESWGGAGPDVVACATDALRDRIVRNARFTGDQRLWVSYPLHPRSDVVASAP